MTDTQWARIIHGRTRGADIWSWRWPEGYVWYSKFGYDTDGPTFLKVMRDRIGTADITTPQLYEVVSFDGTNMVYGYCGLPKTFVEKGDHKHRTLKEHSYNYDGGQRSLYIFHGAVSKGGFTDSVPDFNPKAALQQHDEVMNSIWFHSATDPKIAAARNVRSEYETVNTIPFASLLEGQAPDPKKPFLLYRPAGSKGQWMDATSDLTQELQSRQENDTEKEYSQNKNQKENAEKDNGMTDDQKKKLAIAGGATVVAGAVVLGTWLWNKLRHKQPQQTHPAGMTR